MNLGRKGFWPVSLIADANARPMKYPEALLKIRTILNTLQDDRRDAEGKDAKAREVIG